MSRLEQLELVGEGRLAPPRAAPRRGPRHPEAARALVTERSQVRAGPPATRWRPCYGWLVKLRCADGSKRYRDVKPGTPYPEALAYAKRELHSSSFFVEVWLHQKDEPS